MKKIATLTCLHSNKVCARVSCLSAFQNRTAFFKDYPEDTVLAAMMTCNGCRSITETEPQDDNGIQEKIDRLVHEGIQTVHVGVCRLNKSGNECPRITAICQMLEAREIEVIRGTHAERH